MKDSQTLDLEDLEDKDGLLLLDTVVKGQCGGTGKCFDTRILAPYRDCLEFGIAGGLTPENLPPLMNELCPWLIDISGGVRDPDTNLICPTRMEALWDAYSQ